MSSSVGDGYTCVSCGGYVPYGVSHSCPTTVWPNPSRESTVYSTLPISTDTIILERIAKALERIAETIDR